jgi:hypothetical protein
MKSVLSLIMTALCAQTLYASGLEDLRRTASFEFAERTAQVSAQPVPAAPVPDAVNDDSVFKGPFCWNRGRDVNADRMGLPESFCVRSMKITAGIHANPKLELAADELSGVFDLKLGPPHDGLFKATSIIFNRIPLIQVCAPAEGAYIELNVLIDERGKIVSDPELRSFYGATPDTCGSPWSYREIKYIFQY